MTGCRNAGRSLAYCTMEGLHPYFITGILDRVVELGALFCGQRSHGALVLVVGHTLSPYSHRYQPLPTELAALNLR